MTLPPRVFYRLTEVAARWGCAPADIVDWAAVSRLDIVTSIRPVRCGVETLAGCVSVPAEDLLPMFPRYGSGPASWPVHRIRPWVTDGPPPEWRLIADPADGVEVAAADLMVTGAEVARFEDECGILRRTTARHQRPGYTYDWDGFYLAIIKHIHDEGLPESQSEFVSMMQEWFLRRSEDGEAPDERTIRRRIGPIWRELRG